MYTLTSNKQNKNGRGANMAYELLRLLFTKGFGGPIEVMYKVFLPFKGCAREGVFAELSFG